MKSCDYVRLTKNPKFLLLEIFDSRLSKNLTTFTRYSYP